MSTLATLYAEVRSAGARFDAFLAVAWLVLSASHAVQGGWLLAVMAFCLAAAHLQIVALRVLADLREQALQRLLKAIVRVT